MAESKVQKVSLQGGGRLEIDQHVCVRERDDLCTARPHARAHAEGVREVRRHHREVGRRGWSLPAATWEPHSAALLPQLQADGVRVPVQSLL
jgi:hypothetical protein